MSRPSDPSPRHEPTRPEAAAAGAYARRVREQLRVRCVHLLTKEAYTGIPEAHELEFEADGPVFWCDRTGTSMGPDGRACSEADCHAPGRSCYRAP